MAGVGWKIHPTATKKQQQDNNEHIMKRMLLITPIALALAASQLHAAGKVELVDSKDKASYAIGLSMAGDFKRQPLDLNPTALVAGLQDGLTGEKPQMTDKEREEILMSWQQQQKEKAMARMKSEAEKNQQEGEKFLAENKTKEGVKALPSGVQYKVLKEGTGAAPKPTDTVKTHYRGTLIDGTEFDSTQGEQEPASFVVKEVIPGWTEVLPLMKVGSKWQVVVPSNLAYGERGAGGRIGPNSTLIFEIELVGIGS
jgi:FKBP-type peptidyl-prolyl cis-trans isomerase FklB